ncbi:MAG: hypothetical protein JXB19_01670 [Bacteroidales bacterium]|nr:hypothetical protein [Bacteroidales bacterium]
MKTQSIKTLPIITGLYGVIYLLFTVMLFISGELSFINANGPMSLLLLSLFILGFSVSWKKEKMAGIIFMLWNAGVWINDLYFNIYLDHGMRIIIAVPVLVIGALFLLQWYNTTIIPRPSIQQQWKFILHALLFNYSILYLIYLIADITYGDPISLLSLPGIFFPVLIGFFLIGFILSWEYELFTGIIFFIWYGMILFGTIRYPEFDNRGPHALFGIAILLHGIFYINYHIKFKLKQP